MDETFEIRLPKYATIIEKNLKKVLAVSKILVVTDAREANFGELRASHKSLVVSGSRSIIWFVLGISPEALKKLRRRFSFGRVQVVNEFDQLTENGLTSTDLVVFLSAGDGLQRESLVPVTELFLQHSEIDLLYADSGHPTNEKADPLSFARRPGWSPERLRAHCYVGETLVVRTDLVVCSGGIDDLALRHPHDRALRLTENAKNIRRLAEVLTIAKLSESRPSASLQAVVEHCQRQNIKADCELDESTPSVRVRRRLTKQPTVAVIIATRGTSAEVFGEQRVLVVESVRSLFEKSTYQNFSVVIVADTPTPKTVIETLQQIGGSRLQVINYDRPFNFAEKNNIGAMSCDSDLILLLNDDTEIITTDALETMVAMFNDAQVGVVGPMLLFEDATIQSAGHIFSPDPTDLYRARNLETAGPQNLLRVQREVSSLIGACMLIRRDVFEQVGGLCLSFPGNWNDIDFCLKVQLAGFRAVFTPHAQLYHFESKTRIAKRVDAEVGKLGARWGSVLDDDPYFNPRLQRYTNIWKTDSTSQQSLDDALSLFLTIA
jgi:O-antigen biosynthesis protein